MTPAQANIIDIRRETDEHSILDDIRKGLRPGDAAEKTLPTLLLYDETGLRLFEKITYLDEYYLTNAEIEVLQTYADRIAARIQPGSLIVELGSGNLRKVAILLEAIEKVGKDVEYYALDLSLAELQRTLAAVPHGGYKHVKCFGLLGTYNDGLEWLQKPEISSRPKSVLSLGSSIGNFKRHDAALFLKGFADILNLGDTLLLGIDACKDSEKVYHAYNDRDGLTHEFILSGLLHANKLVGKDVFKLDEWEVIGEYDVAAGRHHAFVSPLKDVDVDGILVNQGEKIRIEESYKYDACETTRLWEVAGLVEGAKWATGSGEYALHLVSKPKFFFDSNPERYAAKPVPSLSDWHNLWAAWDAVTREMIPKEELLSQPIKLRNACIFYLGHIPTFLDIHLTRATKGAPTEPAHYPQIFERGIDPDVENPELCHAHSEIPDSWPPTEEVITFQGRVRQRVTDLYRSDVAQTDRCVGRALWLGYEHEIMHVETLLYMLVQSQKTLPPPKSVIPDFEAMAKYAETMAVPNQWVTVPESDVVVGLDDPENDNGPDRFFGWDNEKPHRTIHVGAFAAKARAITNGEYAHYVESTGTRKLPASWSEQAIANGFHSSGVSNGQVNGHKVNGTFEEHRDGISASGAFLGNKSVRTVYGAVPLAQALHWPVFASYDELAGCAKWMGGRIPTAEEVRSIYSYVQQQKTKDVQNAIVNGIPAVNGHLVNDGVEETPPSQPSSNGLSGTVSGPKPSDFFINLEGANVGFKHWHPVPVTQNGNQLAGQGELGGVWEWTSTVLEKHDGFEPMGLYPGYTADFFDGKHNIVLGGSWATHPRIAGRKSFVNWYQRNYPYVWAGARLVRDL
ncbi:hypothetical protein H2199_003705 [Coniosporium tulheliwenetii]|uniref:Uncharacterized protein n=1 Tax=Coniosporium tulheliwenetii TaxID=3383036 RepID=A0ACC2ZAE2_9PEZI|nr:hypothetical protein H2199_003705 [Cladosporium sp. JES 115]